MVIKLKSYRLKGTLKPKKVNLKKKNKKKKPNFVRDATGAIIGVALVAETASAIQRI